MKLAENSLPRTPPFEKTISDGVMLAALQRRWSVGKIAKAAGVTRQAISSRLCKLGVKPTKTVRKRHHHGKYAVKCRYCGKISWGSLGGMNEFYCSRKCQGEDEKQIFLGDVESAIRMRLAGQSWGGISGCLGFSMQGIQRAIWLHLQSQGKLRRAFIARIWKNPDGVCRGKWNWLGRKFGYPS